MTFHIYTYLEILSLPMLLKNKYTILNNKYIYYFCFNFIYPSRERERERNLQPCIDLQLF